MKIRRPAVAALMLISLTSVVWTYSSSKSAASSNISADDQPVVDWVRQNAVRLQTPEAGHGFADMQPLKKMIGNARIVSLGEATHGTREFFQLKHRMLEFLASEMGFTIFSIEANMPEAYRLNDYVLNGNGDPAKLIRGMYFWTWDTQEVLDMVLWMREFNKSGKGRVQFTGFDMQTPNVAADIVQDFVNQHDTSYGESLRKAVGMAKAQSSSGASFGVATGTFPVHAAAGKHIRYSGYIKTEGVTSGYAGLWWRVDGASGMLAFENMDDRGVTGTTDWKRYEIDLPVSAGATNINFGALLPGNGTAWFDSLAIEVDGVPYQASDDLNLDFETPLLDNSPEVHYPANTALGFHAGGAGYQAQLDNAVFHSGKQSLRIKYLETTSTTESDSKLAVSTWQAVMRHLEESRAVYLKQGVSAKDLDWVIQNARIVTQCMQLNAKEVSRDQSMADNIKWILDQNPGAKIVLWAHNGHVATGGFRGYEPMGVSLRKMFGAQMVVFGFAFNQGSFRAFDQKSLHVFTVPPAPAGSLDATFAATGIPLFAIDLRNVTKSGPVATWFSEPHQSRSIGALYTEDTAAHYLMDLHAPQTYDAMLFVEKTTAARPNP
jgi:erythromycin esterase-like protein